MSDQALLQLLLASGIRHDTTNSLTSARAAHLMLYAGSKDVRLLDGGLTVWTGAGFPLLQDLPLQYPAISDFGVGFPRHPDYLIDMQ